MRLNPARADGEFVMVAGVRQHYKAIGTLDYAWECTQQSTNVCLYPAYSAGRQR